MEKRATFWRLNPIARYFSGGNRAMSCGVGKRSGRRRLFLASRC